jgi:hypothetical protein
METVQEAPPDVTSPVQITLYVWLATFVSCRFVHVIVFAVADGVPRVADPAVSSMLPLTMITSPVAGVNDVLVSVDVSTPAESTSTENEQEAMTQPTSP